MNDPTINRSVLLALRQIIRAMDIRSRELERLVGLTVPQLVVLKQISEGGQSPIGRIAKQVSLSQATVTTIVDRLVQRGLVHRQRDEHDRRRVNVGLTEEGAEILSKSPAILQEQFLDRFTELESWEQTQILATLQRVAAMMDAHELPATPILTAEALTPEQVSSSSHS